MCYLHSLSFLLIFSHINIKDRKLINLLTATSSLRISVQILGTQNNNFLKLFWLLTDRGQEPCFNHFWISGTKGGLNKCLRLNGNLKWLFLVPASNKNAFAILTEGEVMMLFYIIPPSFYTLATEANTGDNSPEKQCSCVSILLRFEPVYLS